VFGPVYADSFTDDERGLIEEYLITDTAFTERVLETESYCGLLVLHLEDSLAWPPEWDEDGADCIKECLQIESRAGVGRNYTSAHTKRAWAEFNGAHFRKRLYI
jgi:hypothetical protein